MKRKLEQKRIAIFLCLLLTKQTQYILSFSKHFPKALLICSSLVLCYFRPIMSFKLKCFNSLSQAVLNPFTSTYCISFALDLHFVLCFPPGTGLARRLLFIYLHQRLHIRLEIFYFQLLFARNFLCLINIFTADCISFALVC